MTGNGGTIKVDPAKVKQIQAMLDDLLDQAPPAIDPPKEALYGDSEGGNGLHADVADAAEHINAAVRNLMDGIRGYRDALGAVANDMTETDEEAAAFARSLAANTSMIQTKFYADSEKATRPDAADGNVVLHFDPETGGKTPVYPV